MASGSAPIGEPPTRARHYVQRARHSTPWVRPVGRIERGESCAPGETSRRRTTGPIETLTPQELQIAQMAAAGLTNPEIAQRLYVSRRTVGTHLYRLFPKLGITSRTQ